MSKLIELALAWSMVGLGGLIMIRCAADAYVTHALSVV